MQMFRIPSSILLPALIILIVITAVTSIVSAYRYVNLVEDTNLMRLSPKDDATWGIMQLNTEILKTSNALYSVQFEDSPDARKNLTLRLDTRNRMKPQPEIGRLSAISAAPVTPKTVPAHLAKLTVVGI